MRDGNVDSARDMQAKIKSWLKRTPLYPLYCRVYGRVYRRRELAREQRDFWNWSEDDERRMAFYRALFGMGDLVFDIGANMGTRTKVFHRLGARVVAFEPQARCYRFLQAVFRNTDGVRLVNRALGREAGTAEMFISDAHVLSSLSAEWIARVRQSGRFGQYHWDKKQTVSITTLDKAIDEFGVPSFVKIDVEGYELEVLSGLSRPLPCLSFEFATENMEMAIQGLDHLATLAPIEVQLTYGESMHFVLPAWASGDAIKRALGAIPSGQFGDVYVRSTSGCPLH